VSRALFVALGLASLVACGPATYTPKAGNAAACPADYQAGRNTACDAGTTTCGYDGPLVGCGAGTTSSYSLTCTENAGVDGGTAWTALLCS